jgi:hypothetical protein
VKHFGDLYLHKLKLFTFYIAHPQFLATGIKLRAAGFMVHDGPSSAKPLYNVSTNGNDEQLHTKRYHFAAPGR